MPKVKFTKMVDEKFGGAYTTGYFTARKGDEVLLTHEIVDQIQKDHKGLIQVTDKNVHPKGDAKAEVVKQAPRTEPEPEDDESDRRAAPRGLDRMFRGGHTK